MKAVCSCLKPKSRIDESKVVYSKTIECTPVIRYSFSATPPTSELKQLTKDIEVIKTCSILINFPNPKISKGLKGSVSSLGTQPITVNLSRVDDPAPTPTPSNTDHVKEFTFKYSA